MKRIAFAAGAALLSATTAAAQDDPASIKARSDAQNAQLGVLKTQLDIENLLKGSAPNNTSAISTGEKGVEAQVLKYLTYRAAAGQLVAQIADPTWKAEKPADRPAPLVIVGTSPPSFSLINTYRSDKATAAAALKSALRAWAMADALAPKPPASGPRTALVPLAALPAIGMLTNVASMLIPSSSVTGAPLTADNAQVATIVEQAIFDAGGTENYAEFELGRGGDATTNFLLAELTPDYTTAKGIYDHQYAVAAATKYENDEKNAAVKAAGTTLSTAIAAYDALHAKLLADNGGVQTAIAIKRLEALESSNYTKRPLLYILGNEASVSVETMKGPAHWFDSHPFKLRSVVTLNYLYVTGTNQDPVASRGLVSCVIIAPKFTEIPNIPVDRAVGAGQCGTEYTFPATSH